jgi:hypothetical protein
MGRACSSLAGKPEEKRLLGSHTHAGRRITLKWILRKYEDWIHLTQEKG